MIPIGKQLEFDPFQDILMQQRKYQGVVMGSTNSKRDIPLYADLYQQGRFNLDDLVSKTIRLEDINEGYAELEGGKIARSVIVFD
jgi:S-(hydroxymethyl)glutathione dehydrogenase/alcohol dehydrogenase